MKAKELMIGDWVNAAYFNGEREFPQGKLQINSIDNVDKGFLIVEPIPLTPEILEANGFEALKDIYGKPICQFKLHTNGITEQYRFVLYGYPVVGRIFTPSTGGEVFVAVTKVHELQHALRFVGLNEMADNFKLTKKGDKDNE